MVSWRRKKVILEISVGNWSEVAGCSTVWSVCIFSVDGAWYCMGCDWLCWMATLDKMGNRWNGVAGRSDQNHSWRLWLKVIPYWGAGTGAGTVVRGCGCGCGSCCCCCCRCCHYVYLGIVGIVFCVDQEMWYWVILGTVQSITSILECITEIVFHLYVW